MKLKRSSLALAGLVVLVGVGLSEAADAQHPGGHGGGGYGARGYAGGGHGASSFNRGGYSAGAYAGGSHGASNFNSAGGYGGGGYAAGAHGAGGLGAGAAGNAGAGGGGHGAGLSGYGGYGGVFQGGRAYARHGSRTSEHYRPYFQGHRQASAVNHPYGSEFGRPHVMSLASNPTLQHATLTRQNAFFEKSRFGGRELKTGWLDHHGRGYGYRWHRSIFWPYLLGDYYSYILWPYGYFNTFWGYGPDVLFLSAFWSYGHNGHDAPRDEAKIYSGDLYYNAGADTFNRSREFFVQTLSDQEMCSGFAPGISDLPIRQLAKVIEPTPEQRAVLGDLKSATERAAAILKQSCPAETPLTPLARLEAMQHRLQAMQEASDVIKVSVLRLYSLLSDPQKQRLEGSAQPNARQGHDPHGKAANAGELCQQQAEFTTVPADQIDETIKLSDAQKQELEKLKAVTAQASASLKESCPSRLPDAIQARLDAAQMRVKALGQAIDTVRPAVHDFYASLTDEQKAALLIQSVKKIASTH